MTKNEFINQMNRLLTTYGEKCYPDERFNAIWDWAKNVNEKLFKLTITEVISNHSQAPMKAKIIEAYTAIRIKNPELKQSTPCIYCGGFGLVCDEQPLPNVYRCRCANGNVMSKTIAEWQGVLVKKFPTESEIEQMDAARLIRQTSQKLKMEE